MDATYCNFAVIVGNTGFVLAHVDPDELPPGSVIGTYATRDEAFEALTTEIIQRLHAEHPPVDPGAGWQRVR
jgi:hypothetical protein